MPPSVRSAILGYSTGGSAIEPDKEWISIEKVISVEIPEHWLQGLDWDQRTVAQEIIQLGTHQLKVRRALEMYQAGAGSQGYVAESVGLSKRDRIREALSPPEHQAELAAGIADARLEIIERAGHNAPTERSAEVIQAVRDLMAAVTPSRA